MKKKTNKKAFLLISLVVLIAIVILWEVLKDDCKKEDGYICNIRVNGYTLNLKVAYSEDALRRGLKWVTSLEENEGMIFVYDEPMILTFWMKDTIIPVSVAFVKGCGTITSIQNMHPEPGVPDHELSIYHSIRDARYAIETNIGWFDERGIEPGDKVRIPYALR